MNDGILTRVNRNPQCELYHVTRQTPGQGTKPYYVTVLTSKWCPKFNRESLGGGHNIIPF